MTGDGPSRKRGVGLVVAAF